MAEASGPVGVREGTVGAGSVAGLELELNAVERRVGGMLALGGWRAHAVWGCWGTYGRPVHTGELELHEVEWVGERVGRRVTWRVQ